MKKAIGKFGSISVMLLLILTASLVYVGCSIESPQAPTWDTDLTVPLITHHYDIYELIDRMAEDALSYDNDGNILISFEQEIDTVGVDAGLTINDINENYNHQLGQVTMDPPPPMSTSLYLEDYVAIAAGTYEDFGFNAGKDFDQMAEFQSAVVSEGQLELTITNEFGLDTDSLTIWIHNTSLSDTILTYVCQGGLPTGQTLIDTVAINGSLVTNQLSLSSRIHTPGGTLFSVSDKNLAVSAVMLDGVTVFSATAQIPSQEKEFSETIDFIDDHLVNSAVFSSGQLVLDIQNTSELSGNFAVTINELENAGQPFTVNVFIPAQSNYQVNQNLSGYQFEPQIIGSDMAVDVDLTLSFPGSGDNLVTIASTDNFAVSAVLQNLEFSQVTGIIAQTEVELSSSVEQIDLPSGMEDVRLTDAVITVNIYSEVDLPVEVSVELSGDAGQQLTFGGAIVKGSPGSPGFTQIVIDDLGNLTSPVPNEITISGFALVGDGLTTGSVYLESRVWGDIEINSPLKFALGETTVDAEINSTDIEQDDIDEISERLLGATIYATISNHLPFGCEVELVLSGDSTTLYSNPQLSIGPYEVESGILSDGLVSDASVTELEIILSESDLDIIENATLYVGQNIYLPGTDGEVVNIISTDYLDIRAYMKLTTRLGGEWD